MSNVTLLIVKQGEADPLDALIDVFARRPEITLAAGKIVSLDEAEQILRHDRQIDAVLLIGRALDLQAATDTLIRAHSTVDKVFAIAIDTGEAHATYTDPDLEDVVDAILNKGVDQAGRGWFRRIFRYQAHIPDNDTSAPAPGEPEPYATIPAEPARVPMTCPVRIEPGHVAVLGAALDWVEAATRALLDAWSGGRDGNPGFGLSWDALDAWLAGLRDLFDAPAAAAEESFAVLRNRLEDGEDAGSPLGAVYRRLGHDPLALKLFLIAVAGELEIKFQRMFGAAHDDYSRRQPSLGLACAIIAAAEPRASPLEIRSRAAALPQLAATGLFDAAISEQASADRPLRVTPQVVDWLASGDPDRLLGPGIAPLRKPIDRGAVELVPASRVRMLKALVDKAGRPAALLVEGEDPRWLLLDAVSLDPPGLVVDPAAAQMTREAVEAVLPALVCAANLGERRLLLDLTRAGPDAEAWWPALVARLDWFERTPRVLTRNAAALLAAAGEARLAVVRLPAPSSDERAQAVRTALARHEQFDEALIAELSARTALAPDGLAAAEALSQAAAIAAGRGARPQPEDWRRGFRAAASAHLPALARRIEPWPRPAEKAASLLDRVVLPPAQREQLEEIVEHARFSTKVLGEWRFAELVDGQGVTALFSGESGTGKTTAAHALASELGADLYAIDLSQVVSKYIGETEKNLNVAFDEVEAVGGALLFDEADALFGKRSAVSDAHDRYANIEVAYLLQRMQEFTGLAILTTNNAGNLDAAFTRRLRFRIEFPRPGVSERLAIWEQSIPLGLRAEELNLSRLALALNITGGTIRQMALHAAMRAASKGTKITYEHVLAGAKSQLIRLGQFDDLAKLEPRSEAA